MNIYKDKKIQSLSLGSLFKNMKKTITGLMLMLTVFVASAQQKQIDSLKQLLNKTTPDSSRANLMVELSKRYYLQKPDSGLIYAAQALAISKKTGNKKGEMHSLTQVGFSMWMLGNMPAASQTFISSLRVAKQLNDKWSIARNYDGISVVYSVQNEFKLAVPYALKSEAIFRQIHDDENVVDELSDIGDFYNTAGQLDSALRYNNRALQMSVKINEWVWRPKIMGSLGMVYAKLGNEELAIASIRKAIAICQYKETFFLSGSYYRLAKTFQTFGQRDSCIFYAKKTFEVAQKASLGYPILNASDLLAQMYDGNNDHEAAKYYKIALNMRDSLFNAEKTNQVMIIDITEQQHETDLKNAASAYQNKIKLFAVVVVLALVVIILSVVWRNNKKQQTANKLLESQKKQIQQTLLDLKQTQTQLIQSEKMASLGELTAGIAHEIQNPLNFVNNFSEVNREMIDELKGELKSGNVDEALVIAENIGQNEEKINHHGKRADAIVKGMLEHSRIGSGDKLPTNINTLADEFMRLSYHGLRAKDKLFNAELTTHFDPNLPKVNVSQQDMGRVMLNLFNNAFYAVNQKSKTAAAGYKPEVSVSTAVENGQVVIRVKDNGVGIPDTIKEKIMQPFFTTKPTGEGTGLGLSLTYDMVVKGHGGVLLLAVRKGKARSLLSYFRLDRLNITRGVASMRTVTTDFNPLLTRAERTARTVGSAYINEQTIND
jgi:signal transduction histidine kinase